MRSEFIIRDNISPVCCKRGHGLELSKIGKDFRAHPSPEGRRWPEGPDEGWRIAFFCTPHPPPIWRWASPSPFGRGMQNADPLLLDIENVGIALDLVCGIGVYCRLNW